MSTQLNRFNVSSLKSGQQFNYKGSIITYKNSENTETTDWYGARMMDVKYIFSDNNNGSIIKLTPIQVTYLQPITGGKLRRRKRTHKRSNKRNHKRTHKRRRHH